MEGIRRRRRRWVETRGKSGLEKGREERERREENVWGRMIRGEEKKEKEGGRCGKGRENGARNGEG